MRSHIISDTDHADASPLFTFIGMADAVDVGSDPATRILARQKTADLSFFTPSSVSFNPKPYLPHQPAPQPAARSKTPAAPSTQRDTAPASAQGQRPPDVSHSDPDATFIRYPFTDFPNSELHPEGLTYNILADLPECFLDPADFRTDTENEPNKIAYPQILEPPRGWCPIRKKGPHDKQVNANEDDAPKLRCTFCRRSYAGVNAKSMWRRHVLEKHKIPMSNRRDGPHEGGGRGRSSSSANSMFIRLQPSFFSHLNGVSQRKTRDCRLCRRKPISQAHLHKDLASSHLRS